MITNRLIIENYLLRNKLIEENIYNLETHKQLVIENLLNKQYDMNGLIIYKVIEELIY